ncbi:MAG TPA: tRNA lysidine(34) synthetase TilS, partial [Desulfomonilia bacterium]|nr:tRNA lysidine(34) synthetase TilS [Desulfomonilia bacterium]
MKRGDSVLICVSGGIDSMVLLDLMQGTRDGMDLRLGVIHVDHGLRKDESGSDARFVQDRCSDLFLEFHLVELNMDPNTANLEEEARKRRYDAIQGLRQRYAYDHAATGHTLDDQAETVLYRVIRGTGIRGLSGMEYRRPDGVIRPMLGISRSRVSEYALQKGIRYVNDRTNDDTRLARNLIRSEV